MLIEFILNSRETAVINFEIFYTDCNDILWSFIIYKSTLRDLHLVLALISVFNFFSTSFVRRFQMGENQGEGQGARDEDQSCLRGPPNRLPELNKARAQFPAGCTNQSQQ